MINGLHHVAIATEDADRLLQFYRDLLGMEEVFDYTWEAGNTAADRITGLEATSARSIMLRKGNAYFEIFQFLSPQPDPRGAERRVCDPGITHICLDVTEIDQEYE